MRTGKWIILTLLLMLLLLGGLFLHPLVRFTVNLYLDRPNGAESVYLSSIRGSDRFDRKARAQLRRYAVQMRDGYLQKSLTYDEALAVLAPLSRTGLPQEDIESSLNSIEAMEAARTALIEANAWAVGGDYARSIPLYRQSLIADDSAAFGLQQAETAYKNRLLEQAEAAMDGGQYSAAEAVLLEGLTLLEGDADLTNALSDVHCMQQDEAYAALVAEGRRLLREEGPEAAFQYAAALRQQAPDAYAYEYLEQLVRREYEDDVCARALSLQAGGDPVGACALLEEGLTRLDSQRMLSLCNDIRATMIYYLADMPLLRDQTQNARTGAESTFTRDDGAHSFYADLGSLTFSLEDGFETFTGTVAFPQGEPSDLYRATATLQVYGDGKLLAEFKNMDRDSAPMPFSLPLSGARELTLCWISDGANGWKDWGRFATVYDGRLIPAGGR